MVDLAIGVIIGTALGKVVSSLVSDVIMPPIGLILGGVDFSALAFKLSLSPKGTPVEIKYGLFINTIIDFFIISVVIFIVAKGMNRLHLSNADILVKRNCPECCMTIPAKAKKCPHCCSEI